MSKDPQTRLGTKGGVEEVLAHPFFADLDFSVILSKDLVSPLTLLMQSQNYQRKTEKQQQESSESLDEDEDDFSVKESVIPEEIEEIIRVHQDKF